MLSPLIDEYGADRVWKVGLEVCGHPISWNPGINQIIELTKRLETGA